MKKIIHFILAFWKDILGLLLWVICLLVFFASCSSSRYANNVDKIIYKDSIVYVRVTDTLELYYTKVIHDSIRIEYREHEEEHITTEFDPTTGNKVREETSRTKDLSLLEQKINDLQIENQYLRAMNETLINQFHEGESFHEETEEKKSGDASRSIVQSIIKSGILTTFLFILLMSLVYLSCYLYKKKN